MSERQDLIGRQDFWSRRKAAAAAEARAEAQAAEDAREEELRREIEEKTDAEALAELNLPDPDTMRRGDDFSAFMAKAVPERLRRRALRRLWTSNPVLANLDELLEYGEDYTDAATVVENMQTVYKLGKGMLAQETPEEGAARTDAGADAAAEDGDEGGRPEEPADGTPAEGAGEPAAAAAEDGDEGGRPEELAGGADEPVDAVPRPRRRMRFAFADDAARRENA